ncbi:MAG TPA: phosphoribosyltransferase [Firmicutes bacterium]|nr:phosphoribosyltransferase [Bacillota bacterium]
MFANRRAAGEALAEALRSVVGRDPLILGVPRGGVPVAFAVWQRLGGDLDIIQPRKIGSPFNPELAIGAVAPDGTRIIDTGLVNHLGVSTRYVESEAARQAVEARRRVQLYRGARPWPSFQGRTVVLVDDGVATGASDQLALRLLRRQAPARLILGVPVAPAETLIRLEAEADQVVCLRTPPDFQAVGQFYADFAPVTDEEVRQLLTQAWGQGAALPQNPS